MMTSTILLLNSFFIIVIAITVIIASTTTLLFAQELTRSCSLADYIRVRGKECEQPSVTFRTITYHRDKYDHCIGPDIINLGETQPCDVCELSDLSPYLQSANVYETCGNAEGDQIHTVDNYNSHYTGGCAAAGASNNLPVAISGLDVPCKCTAQDVRSSFTECVNGSRKLVYYYDRECDSNTFGAYQLPRSRTGPCDIECGHGEFAHPLCTRCHVNTYSFSGHQFVAPYHDLPDDFVEQCYLFDSENNDGATPCPRDSPAGWRPCDDKTCITSGNSYNLHSSDIQFSWHINIVSLPASVSFEYKIESEEYFDWFGVETKTETLMYESGNHPDWKYFQHNFTDIPFSDMCTWSLANSVCVHPNNFAPYDPDSFWKPETSRKVDPSLEPFTNRYVILLPISASNACVETAYTGHPGLQQARSMPTRGDIVFVIEHIQGNPSPTTATATTTTTTTPSSTSSHGGGTTCSFSTVVEHVRKVPGVKGMIMVELGRTTDKSLTGNSSTFPRGLYLGSISIPFGHMRHPAYAPTVDFISKLYGTMEAQNAPHLYTLRWNRNPGHRIQLTFFYSKDSATSVGRDRVELRNIRVEGTVKAVEQCEYCPAGTSTAGHGGRSECTPCPENYYSPEAGSQCQPCPTGMVSPIGSSSCVAARQCTEDDYEAILFGCHLNTSTNMYQQRVSYRLSDTIRSPNAAAGDLPSRTPACSPVPGFSIPDKLEPCNQCFYGEYFDMTTGRCVKCSPHQHVIFEPGSSRAIGCAPCNVAGNRYTWIPDTRIAFMDFLLFNGTLPSDIFSQSCFKCLGGGAGGNEGWEFNALGNGNTKYENQVFFNQGGLGMTVLSVGERILPGGTATLSLIFDQHTAGTIHFTYYTRIPLSLGNPFSPNMHPGIDFSRLVEVIIYDMSNIAHPQKIQQFNLGASSAAGLHSKATTQYFAPGPKKISWIYKNILTENIIQQRGFAPDPILFGLQQISITGANPNHKYTGAERCITCPFGYSCQGSVGLEVTVPCVAGYSSLPGQNDCSACTDRAANGRLISSVSPAQLAELCLDCSFGMFSNKEQHTPGIPSRSFCSLEEAGFVLANRLVFSDTLINNLLMHGSTATLLVKANPSEIQTQIAAVPDYVFASTYNEKSLFYFLDFMKREVLIFPSTNRRRLEVTLRAGLPDQVSCLTPFEKRTTNISFGCATNKASGESFSIGNMISIESIPLNENLYRTGVVMRFTGLTCRSEWTAGTLMRETIVEIACDPHARNLENDLVTEAALSTSVENSGGCSVHVYAKWSKVCPVCNSKNMGFSYTSTCSQSSSSSDATSNYITKTYFFIDAFKRKAANPVCANGLYLPDPVKTPCPWIRDPIQPSNLEVVAIFLCVITLVTIIVYSITYLVRNNNQIKQKYQILRQTYLANQDANENNNNNGNEENTAINDDDPREMRSMNRTNNSSRGRRSARSNSGINQSNRGPNPTATSISEINTALGNSSASTFVSVPVANTNHNNGQEEDRDDVVLNNLDQFNTVHEGIYSGNASPRN